jgi:hypothetical protein
MAMKETTMLTIAKDESFETEHAARLVAEALQRSGLTKAGALEVLEAGFAMAAGHSGPAGTWPRATEHQRAAGVVGRLLARIARAHGWPLEGANGTSAKSFVSEILTR